MLTAVWVAVVAAAAAFVAGVGVAVYVMLKAARLMSETSAAVAGLRERGDLLIERANAAIDQAGEQIARTETVTASMEGVTAAMAELGGQFTALAPALPAAAEGRQRAADLGRGPGVRGALGAREPGARRRTRRGQAGARRRDGGAGRHRPGAGPADRPPAARQGDRPGREAGRRAARPGEPGQRDPTMIRRLFWLVLGAVLGVAGYRKATALARSLRPAPPAERPRRVRRRRPRGHGALYGTTGPSRQRLPSKVTGAAGCPRAVPGGAPRAGRPSPGGAAHRTTTN